MTSIWSEFQPKLNYFFRFWLKLAAAFCDCSYAKIRKIKYVFAVPIIIANITPLNL